GGGAYVNGTAYDVLAASNGIQAGTAFSRVELPAETRLLKFHTEQRPDSVVVKADVSSFTTVAGTPNHIAVAQTVDRLLPRPSGPLSHSTGRVQAMPESGYASGFASLSPAVYAGYTTSTFNSVQRYSTVRRDRMAVLRSGAFSPAKAAGEPIRVAALGTGLT